MPVSLLLIPRIATHSHARAGLDLVSFSGGTVSWCGHSGVALPVFHFAARTARMMRPDGGDWKDGVSQGQNNFCRCDEPLYFSQALASTRLLREAAQLSGAGGRCGETGCCPISGGVASSLRISITYRVDCKAMLVDRNTDSAFEVEIVRGGEDTPPTLRVPIANCPLGYHFPRFACLIRNSLAAYR